MSTTAIQTIMRLSEEASVELDQARLGKAQAAIMVEFGRRRLQLLQEQRRRLEAVEVLGVETPEPPASE